MQVVVGLLFPASLGDGKYTLNVPFRIVYVMKHRVTPARRYRVSVNRWANRGKSLSFPVKNVPREDD